MCIFFLVPSKIDRLLLHKCVLVIIHAYNIHTGYQVYTTLHSLQAFLLKKLHLIKHVKIIGLLVLVAILVQR